MQRCTISYNAYNLNVSMSSISKCKVTKLSIVSVVSKRTPLTHYAGEKKLEILKEWVKFQ